MTNITTLRPGEHFMFKGFEWICLDPHHPDGGVMVVMAKPWAKDVKFCPSDKFADEKGNWNNYRTSNVRGILSEMENAVFDRKSLLSHTVFNCGDKDSGTGYASVVRSVSVGGWLYNYGSCDRAYVVPACILNPTALNLRQSMAYVEEVSE